MWPKHNIDPSSRHRTELDNWLNLGDQRQSALSLGGVNMASEEGLLVKLLERAFAIPLFDWLVTLIVFGLALLIVDAIALIVRRIWYAPKHEIISLTIKEGGEPGVARLVTSARRSLKLDLGGKIRIWSVSGEPASRYARADVTLWGRNDNSETLAANEIELPREILQTLFPEGYDADKPQRLEISKIVLEGFSLYWFDPNPSSRFQNRFAVYLSTFLTVLSLVVGLPR